MCDLLGAECLKLLDDSREGFGGALFRLVVAVIRLIGLVIIKVVPKRLYSRRSVANLFGLLFCSFQTGSLHWRDVRVLVSFVVGFWGLLSTFGSLINMVTVIERKDFFRV